MKKILLAAVLVVCLVLSGCSYSQIGIDSLLAPPKLSDQQNEIYTALETSVGKNIKLKYPRLGDFTSAFLINNVDDEPTQEAIVFYENPANASATMPLRVNLLDQQDGKWVSKAEVGVEANEVEKVSFISSNQQIYIVIGYNLLSKSEKLVVMYTYTDGMLKSLFSTNCADYEVFDIDDDKSSEIITFVQKKSDREVKSTSANVYKIGTGGTRIVSETPMDPNVTEYISIQKGKLMGGKSALYIDGLKGTNTLCTEILTYEEKGVKNLIYNTKENKSLIANTIRTYGSLTVDLNQDGVFEIPTVKPAPSYQNLQQYEQLSYFTDWHNYVNGELVPLKTTYVAYSLGYIFTLPQIWIDKVTVQYVPNDNELFFYEYDAEAPKAENAGGIQDEADKLLSIKVVQRDNYESDAVQEGYSLLVDNGQILYTYKIYPTTSSLRLTHEQVSRYFDLL